jgi:glycosyltransferase involved in cell wall biosynthesis
MRDKCRACPVDGYCFGQDALPHLCEWAVGLPSQRKSVVDRHRFPAPGIDPLPPADIAGGNVAVPPFRAACRPNEPRVRVGILCPCLMYGGAEMWMKALIKHVDPSKVCWAGLAVIGGDPSKAEGLEESFLKSIPVGFGDAAAHVLAAACDVLLMWAVPGVARFTNGLARKPAVIAAAHSPPESEWAVRVYFNETGVDRYVAVSDLAVPTIPAAYRAEAVVIPNCVDDSRMSVTRTRGQMRESWGVPVDAPVAGYLGRLSDEKDPDAMRRLGESLPDPWRVVVVGGGHGSIDSQGRLKAVGVDALVGDVLAAFDVLIVPSFYESFGLTIAEGLWAGVPVISTPSGIAKLHPGLTRIVPVGSDGPTLAAAVLADRADHQGTARRVLESAKFVREKFNSADFGRLWGDYLVASAPPRPPQPQAVMSVKKHGVSFRSMVESVNTRAYLCRQCAAGCQQSKCLVGKGIDEYGNAPLSHCYDCINSKPEKKMSKSFRDLTADMQAKKADLTSKETAATESKRISDEKAGEVVAAATAKAQSESDFGKALNRFKGYADPGNNFIYGRDENGQVVLYQPAGGDKFNLIILTSDSAEVPPEEDPVVIPPPVTPEVPPTTTLDQPPVTGVVPGTSLHIPDINPNDPTPEALLPSAPPV